MSTVAPEEVERLAFGLTHKERAELAGKLLASIPSPIADDDDDGVEESLRRSREMDSNPAMSLTHDEFIVAFDDFRRK